MATEEELLRAKEKYKNDLLSRRGVHAVGIGLKMRGGTLTKDLAIVCFVDTKLDVAKLDPDDVIPRLLDSVPTDVQETPVFEPFASDPNDLQQKVRPLAGGLQLQVGGYNGTLGFLGMLNGSMVAVSNQHVLESNGVTNFQPTNASGNDIGTTTNVVLSTEVDGGYTTLVTATGVAGIYKWNGSMYALVPVAGMSTVTTGLLPYPVWKTGRTTGTTLGSITSLIVSGISKDGWQYENQIYVTPPKNGPPFALGGDSGSAIVDSFNYIVGLLWGGSAGNGAGSPIAAVTGQLGITVATGDTEQLQQPVIVSPFGEALARLNSEQKKKNR